MIAYQYTKDGYFVGAIEDYGILPNNATYLSPKAEKAGFVQRYDGKKWSYVEDHRGESGWVGDEFLEIKEYGPLPKGFTTEKVQTPEEKGEQIRHERNSKLSQTDYLVMPDYTLEESTLVAVKEYRQSLRDITSQPGFPESVVWPEMPNIKGA